MAPQNYSTVMLFIYGEQISPPVIKALQAGADLGLSGGGG